MGEIDPKRAGRMPLEEPKITVGKDVAGVFVEERERAAIRRTTEKPPDMRPARTIPRRMGIFRFIGVDVMKSVCGHPTRGRVLQAAEGDRRQRSFEPERHFQAAMGEQSVVTEVDAHAKHVRSD